MDLPDLSESAETAREGVKNLISWLSDPYECPDCNVYCDATETYNPQTAAFDNGACPAWECPECGEQYVRVEDWHE